jgi:integrase
LSLLSHLDCRAAIYAAHKALAIAKSVFNWGMVREYGGLDRNPCHLVKAGNLVGRQKPRQRVLTDAELRLIWQATEGPIERTYPVAPFVRLLLLTGARRNEVARMKWSEVNLDKALWIVPADRMKGDEPHEVPLSPMAVGLLASLPRFAGDCVFSTNGGRRPISGFGNFKDDINRRICRTVPSGIPDWRFHDLRRTMRTNLSTLGVSVFVSELVIGHRQKGVHAVYDVHRYEHEKRQALELWAAKLRSIVDPQPNNVVELAVRASS